MVANIFPGRTSPTWNGYSWWRRFLERRSYIRDFVDLSEGHGQKIKKGRISLDIYHEVEKYVDSLKKRYESPTMLSSLQMKLSFH